MLQKALALVFALASIAGCVGCSTTSHFLYATLPAANQLAVYREDPRAGVLTQIDGSPYSVGDGAHSVIIHPSGKFLYVANPGQNENDISLFSIESNGVLDEVFPRTTVTPLGSEPELLLMNSAGTYLYAENAASNNISVFSINTAGTDCPQGTKAPGCLTQVSGSPFPIGLAPLNMVLAPSGNFLYVTAASQPLGLVAAFSITAGKLQLLSLTSTGGVNPFGLAIDPSGKHLYVANTSSNSISIFDIGSAGALTQVSGSPLADTYNDPVAMILDPKGQFLYVANQASNNVSVYSISSTTGLPTGLTTSTSFFAFATATGPTVLSFDPDGNHLFVGAQGSPGIQSFQVTQGNLNPIFTYKVGNSPTSIAVTP
jgi:6-phosphogluconolactonase